MSQRGRERGPRANRSKSSSARRPVRSPRQGVRGRIRERSSGLNAKRASGAARVLGMSNTRRAAVVAVVICALVFTLAVPLRTYVTQRAEVSEQEAQRVELQQEVAALEARHNQLADPAQVEAEARRRLRFVMPGETPYIVQLPEDKAQPQQPITDQQAATPGAWYERLWSSVHG